MFVTIDVSHCRSENMVMQLDLYKGKDVDRSIALGRPVSAVWGNYPKWYSRYLECILCILRQPQTDTSALLKLSDFFSYGGCVGLWMEEDERRSC